MFLYESCQLLLTVSNKFRQALKKIGTVKLGDKECFDKEQIGVKEPVTVNKCQFTS